MYDHQTESLWSQVKRSAVAGPMTGTVLKTLPSTLTTWEKWRRQYPDTHVLSFETGYGRDYSHDPYGSFRRNRGSWRNFLSSFIGHRLSEKDVDLVIGVDMEGVHRAYRLEDLRERGKLTDMTSAGSITLSYDVATDSVSVTSPGGAEIPYVLIYWFVWKETHPEADLHRPQDP